MSTLDILARTWDDIQTTATDSEDVPGRCYGLLTDHTAILVDRGANRESFGTVSVRCTGDLNVVPGLATRMWIRHPNVSSMPAPVAAPRPGPVRIAASRPPYPAHD